MSRSTDIHRLMGLSAVRYAVVVADPAQRRRVVAVQSWAAVAQDARPIDPRACRDAVAAAQGEVVAAMLVVLPLDDVPLTEQGKPDRAAILVQASS